MKQDDLVLPKSKSPDFGRGDILYVEIPACYNNP